MRGVRLRNLAAAAVLLFVAVSGALLTAGWRPSVSSRGSILWSGDFETNNLSQWHDQVQEKAAGRIVVVQSPVRQGTRAARVEVKPGDDNVAGSGPDGERAELMLDEKTTGGYEGNEQWWAWSTMFGPGTDRSGSNWNIFLQFHQTASTGQPTAFSFSLKRLELWVWGGDPGHPSKREFVFDRERKLGSWYDFVFHVRWSSNPRRGFVELYENGRLVVPRTYLATLYDHQGVYLKQGYYRVAQPQTGIIYFDGTRLGTSYASVVAGFPAGEWPARPPTRLARRGHRAAS